VIIEFAINKAWKNTGQMPAAFAQAMAYGFSALLTVAGDA